MEENQMTILKPMSRRYSWSGLSLFVAGLIPAAIGIFLNLAFGRLQLFPKEILDNRMIAWAVSFLPMYGIGIPVGLLLLRKVPAEPATPKKMSAKGFWTAFLMCFPMIFFGAIIGNLLAQILSGGRSVNNVVELVSKQDPMIVLTMIIAAPTLEELIFRKFLIDRTLRFGEKNAVLFSALAFGLFHCNLYQFFYATGIGLMFGYVYVRTRNIKYTMAMHFMINFLSGVIGAFLMNLADPKIMDLVISQDTEAIAALLESDPEAFISSYVTLLPMMIQNLATMGLGIAGVVLLSLKRKSFIFQPQPEELTGKAAIRAAYLNAGVALFIVLCLVQTVFVFLQTIR